jgi:hypothetical protein
MTIISQSFHSMRQHVAQQSLSLSAGVAVAHRHVTLSVLQHAAGEPSQRAATVCYLFDRPFD